MGLIFLAIFLALATTNFAPSIPQQQSIPLQASAQKDCSYNVESNTWVEVGDLSPIYGSDTDPRVRDFFGSTKWVMIKPNISIPAYKVHGGARFNPVRREMDKVGLVVNASSDNERSKGVYVGLGHCMLSDSFKDNQSPTTCFYTEDTTGYQSGPNSRDPITTALIFVPRKEGRGPVGNEVGINDLPGEKNIEQDTSDQYWYFDVYINEELLKDNAGGTTDYTNADAPCWIAQCRGGDLRIGDDMYGSGIVSPLQWNYSCSRISREILSNSPVPTPNTESYSGGIQQSLNPGESYPPSFIRRDWVDVTIDETAIPTLAPAWPQVQDYSWFAGKVLPTDDSVVQSNPRLVGQVQGRFGTKDETFNVYAGRLVGGPPFADGQLFLQPTANSTGYYYAYLPATNQVPKEDTLSLQLGTFNPTLGVTYQWWYPSCKPVVYLYPQKETSYNVMLRPFGYLTDSIPHYPFFGGWQNVIAQPNGDLSYQGQNYNYLYYEGRSIFVKVPNQGYTVAQTELSDLFDYVLPRLGLDGKEIDDFKEYWLSRLNDENAYYFVSVLPREEIDRVEPMKVEPDPDTLIRTRLFFKKVDGPAISILPQLGEKPERVGDTIVDWGGFFK
ncbi:hypothetical protein HYT02_00030 [Candidatus Gottesmanbacteria bacterium]|nr:hypothetical protein [Candidatus Gottesmanbacteria bacterium]